ncbi:MAG: DUF3667 domain-containing protein [Bacteroidetes bacterium]|nr:DUF3667 domain-containing protein [Bacteroidota bacterium]
MKKTDTICNNCHQKVVGNYCSFCGQRMTVGKVTFKEIFNDLFTALFSVEAPFLVTIRLLFLSHGTLFRNYLSGKRKSYYKPVAFFILITVVHILIRSLIKYDPFDGMEQVETSKVDPSLFVEAGQFMVTNINNVLFFFVLTLALSLKLFFYKYYTFVEYLVVSFYLVSVYSFFGTLALLYLKYLDGSLQALGMLLMFIYFLFAMVSFFKEKRILVLVKSILSYIVALLLYVVLGFGISVLIVYFKQ